jgi:anti-sigma B factor antagonist
MELSGRSIESGVFLVELREDALDAARVRAFKDTFTSVVGSHNKVVLDLQGVRFVDSSGMGALISCLRLLDGRGGDLRLASLSKPVRALLELMRMHRVFNIHETPAEAARAFA